MPNESVACLTSVFISPHFVVEGSVIFVTLAFADATAAGVPDIFYDAMGPTVGNRVAVGVMTLDWWCCLGVGVHVVPIARVAITSVVALGC